MTKRGRTQAAGFGLLSLLIWTLIITSLSLALAVRVTQSAGTTGDLERQLYSQILAANGIEYARAILPEQEIHDLLFGLDREFEGTGFLEWRNPLPFSQAREIDPGTWETTRDDGIPTSADGTELEPIRNCEGNGYFTVRFSNNPEEPPDEDRDGVVIVRSMGIAPGLIAFDLFPAIRNSVTLIEARLRRERTFALQSPLTILGDSGDFRWSGTGFVIAGANQPAVSIIELGEPALLTEFESSLEEGQRLRLSGAGINGSIVDATLPYRTEPTLRPVYSSKFWEHFQEQLPGFAGAESGILYFPGGGSFTSHHRGVVVARSDFTVGSSAFIEGLVLHLGGGRLALQGDATVRGGVWISNLSGSSGVLVAEPVQLSIGEEVSLLYDPQALNVALACFPATQLGWRIVSPEMIQ